MPNAGESRLNKRQVAEECASPGANTDAMAMYMNVANHRQSLAEQEMLEFYAAAAAATIDNNVIIDGTNATLADYGFDTDVETTNFTCESVPEETEEAIEREEAQEERLPLLDLDNIADIQEDEVNLPEASLGNGTLNRLGGRRVASVMSPPGSQRNSLVLDYSQPDPIQRAPSSPLVKSRLGRKEATIMSPPGSARASLVPPEPEAGHDFSQSRLYQRRDAGVMSPTHGTEKEFQIFRDAAEMASGAGDDTMSQFYMEAAAAATMIGVRNIDNMAEYHVDDFDGFEETVDRSSRLESRTLAGTDDQRMTSNLTRSDAGSLRPSQLQRKQVDNGIIEAITKADLGELMAKQLTLSTSAEMVELAQHMAEQTMAHAKEAERATSPRSPQHGSPRSRRKSTSQENAYTTIVSPRSSRKSFDTQIQNGVISPKLGRKSYDQGSQIFENARRVSDSSNRRESTEVQSPAPRQRRSSMDPTGGLMLPLSPQGDKVDTLNSTLLNDIIV